MSPKINPNNVRIFSGRSHPALAAGIANYLEVPLDETLVQHFANDCLGVQLCASVRGRIVYVVQSLTPSVQENLMELLMMLDIARNAGASEVHAIIPYYAYARSDKKDAPRISIAARLVADLLKASGATQVMTMQLHTPQVHGFFSIPTDPLTARGLFVHHLRKHKLKPEEAVVVAPDAGIAKSAARLARLLGLSVAVGSKQRFSDTEVKISRTIRKQVKGYECAIIYDDENLHRQFGGDTQQNPPQKHDPPHLCCMHPRSIHRPSRRTSEQYPQIEEIIVTDTVPTPSQKVFPKLTVLSVAETFGEAIRKNYNHESIGTLFTFWEEDEI